MMYTVYVHEYAHLNMTITGGVSKKTLGSFFCGAQDHIDGTKIQFIDKLDELKALGDPVQSLDS